MKRYPLFFLLVGFLLTLPPAISALEYKYQERVLKNTAWHQKNRTPYIWGGTDCSGTMYDIFFKAGVPVVRSTAWAMSRGRDGWTAGTVERERSVPTDVVFWNVLQYDPRQGKLSSNHPHVGVKTSSKTMAHASGGRRYFLEDPFDSAFGKKIEIIRRLTHGDKK
jgi:cell wall-associated NlpC family hydrolase